MKKMNDKELKQCLLDMMISFKTFCEKKQLNYSLIGGTLLGAIRHHGFIPWDDDVDFCLSRPDYDQMRKLFENGEAPEHLKLLDYSLGNFKYPFARIVDTRTHIKQKYIGNDSTDGVWIDIFPIDGLPNSKEAQIKIYKEAQFIYKLMMLNASRFGSGTTLVKKLAKMIAIPCARIIGDKRCDKKLEELASQKNYTEAEYVGCVIWGLGGAGEIMKKSEFESYVQVSFENVKFNAISCWDLYLTNKYGEYMQLPPEKEHASHSFEAWKD